MNSQTKSSAKSERTKSRILEAASELILDAGFRTLTHRAIAERAGLPLGATTYHFESLEQIVLETLAFEFERDAIRQEGEISASALAKEPLVSILLTLMLPPAFRRTKSAANMYARMSEAQASDHLRNSLMKHIANLEKNIGIALRLHSKDPSRAGLVMAALDGRILQWITLSSSWKWLEAQIRDDLDVLL